MKSFSTAAFLLVLTSHAWGQSGAVLVDEDFHAQEQGGTLIKTWKELGSPEAQAIITGTCAAFEVDCSQQAAAVRTAAVLSRKLIKTRNIITTARIDYRDGPYKTQGDDIYGKFDAWDGYTLCKAGIDIIRGSISPGSTFNGTIQRSGEDGLGLYAVVPKNRTEGKWVSFRLATLYVPIGTLNQYGC
jgi:hypothetical protein